MARIAAIGEVMVELSPYPTAQEEKREVMALSYAGDTFNTSVYMARLGTQVDYVTILGDDPYSDQILARAQAENIGTGMIERLPGRAPGLYIIRNTPDGEREFFYWRKEAPARELFNDDAAAAKLAKQLAGCDAVYLSGITLAIMSETARITLGYLLAELRSEGITVAFDSNYRPRLWPSKEAAQKAMLSVLQHTDIALLTLDDEGLLWGDDSIDGAKRRYADLSLQELVLKRGAEESIIIRNGQEERVPVPKVNNVIDTTGAGDTFNAGYMAARLKGAEPADAAKEGTRCAGIVIRHRGGVIDKMTFEGEYNA
ncbi:sugar kinase [Marinimicrobium alkaliphilum]|uniref:sugar kinase n=1 Tax=Marinimicrobium alkaliphilum TaxID=2202654 RepID=UPI000DB92F83|nr:sugar kinase [Marinimicrobium alkaliphilum]